MGIQTHEGIAVVENCGRGMRVETYQSPLAMVLSVMDHGALGGGDAYGCDKHKAALNTIEKHLAWVRARIEQHNKDYGDEEKEED